MFGIDDIIYVIQNQLLSQLPIYGNVLVKERTKKDVHFLSNFFIKIQQALQTNCFVEIGSFDATDSIRALRSYPDACFFAFEANPFNFKKFAHSLSVEYPQIKYIHRAICDINGYVTFRISDEFKGSQIDEANAIGSMCENVLGNNNISVNIPAQTLDTLALEYGFFDKNCCLWIDVEGAQVQVLKGSTKLMPKVTSIYIEIDTAPNFVSGSEEFEVYRMLINNNFMPVLRDYYWGSQYNLVAIRKDLLSTIQHHLANYIAKAVAEFRNLPS